MNILYMAGVALIFVAIATYLLLPLPILSFPQSELVTDTGKVDFIRYIRPGVIEVGIKQQMEIDPALQGGSVQMVSASSTSYVHFRGGQKLPPLNEKISVFSINRYQRFTGRSFNWVRNWTVVKGESATRGRVSLALV